MLWITLATWNHNLIIAFKCILVYISKEPRYFVKDWTKKKVLRNFLKIFVTVGKKMAQKKKPVLYIY